MVPLVLEVQQQHMNLTGSMACTSNILFADDEVMIQFYADARCCVPAPLDRSVSHAEE